MIGETKIVCLLQVRRRKKTCKNLHCFPLKSRLQRLFMCFKTAEHMRWHVEHSSNDRIMRHPRDCEAWKRFDTIFPEFAYDPRNVQLGLASDGFNPFGTMSTNYIIWPAVLVPYNLPPLLCMKQPNLIISMIISGLHTAGNNINVYLQALIKELNKFWCEGIETCDSSKNEIFRMRAALMWTVSDFPGLDILLGGTHILDLHSPLVILTQNFVDFLIVENGALLVIIHFWQEITNLGR